MNTQQYDLKVGGAAGQGLNVVGGILSKALARSGLCLFGHQDYYSRVRGGHNFYHVRASSQPVFSYRDEIDILVALDQASADIHAKELGDSGVMLYDSATVKPTTQSSRFLPISLAALAEQHGGRKLMSNTVAAGLVWRLLSGDAQILNSAISSLFSSKGRDVVEANVRAAKAGADAVESQFSAYCRPSIAQDDAPRRMVLTGNEALALGAMAAGCQFASAYPMTPASSVVEYMSIHAAKMSLVFEQAEDEIAAINMAIGASHLGLRSMVATSGGGFALMVEGLSLAGCTETPLVIVMGQRPGPSTGMATRTEQGELLFCLWAGHGEFPRAILTPGTAEEAFWAMIKAHNLADKYQIPVFVMTDQHLADTYFTMQQPDPGNVIIDRGVLASRADLDSEEQYMRYRFTPSGVSPRAFPGQSKQIVASTGNEHDQYGMSSEDKTNRRLMVEKRLSKTKGVASEICQPKVYGYESADIVLLTWGSSYGACREAVAEINESGDRAKLVHLPEVWPFPGDAVIEAVGTAKRLVTVEMNATGQIGRLLRMETGIRPDLAVLKYDGRPMNAKYVIEQIANGGQNPW